MIGKQVAIIVRGVNSPSKLLKQAARNVREHKVSAFGSTIDALSSYHSVSLLCCPAEAVRMHIYGIWQCMHSGYVHGYAIVGMRESSVQV